ncbi:hypothetical protein OG474_11405 [Kribbella sp. NBC_01505]|uniref:hypothetical protein n=1 Tax=Kribbella sp. NBC_01505 TaxID=2903580 RepID=UPI00386B3220
MIVRCIANVADSLPPTAYDSGRGITAETEFPLTLGCSYPVYGITVLLGLTWYYVLNDDDLPWPVWAPAPLFEIVDGRFPASWQCGYFVFGRDNQYPLISFPEWATDYFFYERLVDGEPAARAIFDQRRREIEVIDEVPATEKDEGVLQFLRALGRRASGWEIKDHWAGDLTAIGVVSSKDPELLAYVSSCEQPDGYYYVELEEQAGSVAYETTGQFERCALADTVEVVARHLVLPGLDKGDSDEATA